jgi:hypothetical protein
MNEPRTYQGSCHCGRIRFELQAAVDQVFDCNCSICRRKGALWYGAQPGQLRILGGEQDLRLYQFHTKTAEHYFCPDCGIHPFSHPRIDPTMWVVNVRCIDAIELARLTVLPYDGRNWEAAAKALMEQRRSQQQ